MTDVENQVSTRLKKSTLAQWGIKDGRYFVKLNLSGCWSEAIEIIYRAKMDNPAWKFSPEKYEEAFCDSLAASYLIERICIERNRQRIRLKRNHCKPCCIERIMVAMHNHVNNVFTYEMTIPRDGALMCKKKESCGNCEYFERNYASHDTTEGICSFDEKERKETDWCGEWDG